VRLTLLCAFGAGYVLGTKAGRERYEQLRGLAHGTAERLESSGLRQQLGDFGHRLETYASQSRRSGTRT
jgi:hypothetical protein